MGGHGDSPTGGVKPMSLGGRLILEKERLSGMTNEERAWRSKWLKDQILTPREPVYIPANTKELVNPIRRFYKAPLDTLFFKLLQPVIGVDPATVLRFYTGRFLIGLWATYGIFYYFKYNTNTWERKGGWRVIESRLAVYPGEPGYPKEQTKTKGSDYCDRGFSESIFGKKIAKEAQKGGKCKPEFVF